MNIRKIFTPFLFLIFFVIYKSTAQITVVPELSSNYVQKLIDTAKANYPKVKSYQNHINISKANLSKTGLSLFEGISVSYVYQPGQVTINPASPATSYFKGLQSSVSINLGTIIERPALMKQAREELIISKNDQEEYFITLATEVKKRYYTYVERLEELKLQTKALQDADQSLKDIRSKFQKGEEPFDTFNKAQSDYTNHQTSKIQAEVSFFTAKADLEELLCTKLENIK